MKKLLLFIFVLIACFLIGCGNTAKVTTIDPDTGKKETYKIEATDNEDEVIDALYNLLMSDVKIGSYNSESIDLSFKIEIESDESAEEKINANINGNFNLKYGLDDNVEISNLKDMLDASMASGKVDIDGTFSQDLEEKKVELDLQMFLESGMIYFTPSVNQEVIDAIASIDEEYSEVAKLVNNNWFKYDISKVIPEEYLALDLKVESDKTIYDLLEDNEVSKEDLRTLVENIVKEYKIKISKVNKNTITLVLEPNTDCYIEIVIDTKTMQAVSTHVVLEEHQDQVDMHIELDANINYETNVEKISDENKAKAVDLDTLMNMFSDSSGIASIEEIIEHANEFRIIYDYEVVRQGTANFEVPAGGYDGSEVTITFYHTMGSNLSDVLNYYIADFNKKYPNIHINHMQVGGYDDVRNMISTELLMGTSPNIAYCYPDHVALYNRTDSVVTLGGLASSGESDGAGGMLGLTANDSFNIIDIDEGRRFGDGELYSLPLLKSTDLMYYNKTFFETHGIPVPDHWFSTDEDDLTSMEAVIKAIKEIDPYSIPLGCDSESNLFINMCAQIGSDFISADSNNHYLFNNKYNKGFMAVFHDWYQNGYMTTSSLYGSYVSSLFVNTDDYRAKCYIAIASSASATHLRPSKENNAYPFEVGIVAIPQMSSRYQRVLTQGPSLCIFKKDNPQEVIASWLFVKYLVTSLDFQAEFSLASGYMSALRNIQESKIYKEFLDRANGYDYIQLLALKVCLDQEWSYFTPSAFDGSANAKSVIKELFVSILSARGDNFEEYLENRFASAESECKDN